MMIFLKVFFTATVFFVLTVCAAMGAETFSAQTDSTHGSSKILVYYLYFNPRCETCLNMEAYSKEAVEKNLSAEVKQGRVEWRSFDIDKPEHKHFWDDYKLDTKALVMVEMKDGKPVRWKNCDKIWDLADNKPAFLKYVRDEVRSCLTEH